MTKYASIMNAPANQASARPGLLLPMIRPADLSGLAVPPRVWCVPEWFPDRRVSLLSGDGGTGKSLLAMQLATCCALGLRFLGMELAPRNVVYLACEDDADELHRRQDAICASLGVDIGELGDALTWVPMVGSDATLATPDKSNRMVTTPTYAAVRQLCKDKQTRLLIVDTAADTFAGLEIDRLQVTRYVRHLERIAADMDGAVIVLSHPSVAGLRDRTGISGNTAWRNAVRSVVYLSRPEDEEARDIGPAADDVRYLERLKGNYSPKGGRITLRYEAGAFTADVGASAINRLDVFALQARILSALREVLKAGQRPSPAKTAETNVVRILHKTKLREHVTKAQLSSMVDQMLGDGSLRLALLGRPSNQTRVVVPADFPPLPDERDPETGKLRRHDE